MFKYWWIPTVCTWSFSQGDFKIPLNTTHFCSNVLIKTTESITLVVILDLIHLAAREVLPSFWKHIYYLPTVGNIVGVFRFNILEDVVAIHFYDYYMLKCLKFYKKNLKLYHKTVCSHYLWWLHHSGWYFGNTKHNCFGFFL